MTNSTLGSFPKDLKFPQRDGKLSYTIHFHKTR